MGLEVPEQSPSEKRNEKIKYGIGGSLLAAAAIGGMVADGPKALVKNADIDRASMQYVHKESAEQREAAKDLLGSVQAMLNAKISDGSFRSSDTLDAYQNSLQKYFDTFSLRKLDSTNEDGKYYGENEAARVRAFGEAAVVALRQGARPDVAAFMLNEFRNASDELRKYEQQKNPQ